MSALPQHVFLFKRSNGISCNGYTRSGCKRWKSTGVTTKPDVPKALTEFWRLVEEQRSFVFLEPFARDSLVYAEANFGQHAFGLYRGILTRWLKSVRDIPLAEITPEHIDCYKAQRLVVKAKTGRPVNPVTVNLELRAALGDAVRWKPIDSNPCEGMPFADVAQHAPSLVTVRDFQRLLGLRPEGWLREVVVFATLAGFRRGEIVSLR
jgi:hypothetical protein